MPLELSKFYKASNPSRTLVLGKPEDRQYYIDFSTVRGGDIVRELERTITLLAPDEPTSQLFTGHIGCGKSTELFRLKMALEQKGFHVVYFESDHDLEMADVDVTDILLVIAHQVSQSLEAEEIHVKPGYFETLFQNMAETLRTPLEISDVSFSVGIATITSKAKESPELRSQLRQYLEPRTKSIIDAINQELLRPAIAQIKAKGKKGLVAIVDNLDRVYSNARAGDRSQPEYLFVDRGDQLKRLDCHVVYTIPLSLIFSNDLARLANRFGVGPKVLPMVPVQTREGVIFEPGMALLRQMVMARAFPQLNLNERIDQILEVFDDPATLDRLCRMSGGHMRNLVRLLYGCLQKEDPPISRATLDAVIRNERDALTGLIDDQEWELLFQAVARRGVQGHEDYQILLRSLFLFEYRDEQGRWFGINPVLAETERFKAWESQAKHYSKPVN